MNIWLADTGPLIALLVSKDEYHPWAAEQAKHAPAMVYSCEAVIIEALFLLKRKGYSHDDLFPLVDTGFLRCEFDFRREYRAVRNLMRRYADQPMSYADACLVRLAELHPGACVWTLDRDFQVYRRSGRQTISLVTPW
ncbi:MAG TPA: type II toxin-antitoxin system VapC family toxin [Opitutales bacterium]|jgi:predicted nucleic acid-binding protein|nr:type II toxin-antitoxin system VapC family toxin [Opitutales bacterium]